MSCPKAHCTWWRWVIVFVTFWQYFLALGFLYNFSILLVSLQDEFKSGAAVTGWLGSLAGALSCLVSPITCLLQRMLSKRAVVLLGVAIFCAGLLMTSYITALGYGYLTFGIFVGFGGNFMIHSSMTLVIGWFASGGYSRASAITLLGSTCGLLAISPLLTMSIDYWGWRSALRIISGGIFVLGVSSGLLLTEPPPEPLDKKDVKNIVPTEKVTDGNFENCAKDETEKNGDEKGIAVECVRDPNSRRNVLQIIKDPEPWLWFIGNMLTFLGWSFFNFNFASFMKGLDFTSTQTAVALMIFAAFELGGKILVAVVGDRLPFLTMYLFVVSCLSGTVLLGILTVATNYIGVVTLAGVSGFARSLVYGSSWAATAQLFQDTYKTDGITILSLVPVGIGTLISAPLSGVLYDVSGDYILSLLVIAAIFLTAPLILLTIPLRRKLRSRGLCCSHQLHDINQNDDAKIREPKYVSSSCRGDVLTIDRSVNMSSDT